MPEITKAVSFTRNGLMPTVASRVRVLPRAAQRKPEARLREQEGEADREDEQHVADGEEVERIERVESRKLVPDVDREPVLAAVCRPRDGEVVDHLGEGQRDHDEEDAGGAEARARRSPARLRR